MNMNFNSRAAELVKEGSEPTNDDTTLVDDLAVGRFSLLMSNRSSSSLSWSKKKSSMLRNLANDDTMLAKGPAERCRRCFGTLSTMILRWWKVLQRGVHR